MELNFRAHLITALKNIYTLSLFVLTVCTLHAQKPVGIDQIQYDSEKKIYKLVSTGKPYTGRAYSVNYYSQNDTTVRQGFTNGKLDYNRSYSNGKLSYEQIYYNKKFKKDSICYEYYTFEPYSGDTTYYEYHWIDKNKVKWGRSCSYHYAYGQIDRSKNKLASVQNFRFYSRSETKDWTDYNFTNEASYDSAGYHTLKDAQGYYATFYADGKRQVEGWNCAYENRVKNKGAYSYYYSYCGTYKYYNQEGLLYRQDEYIEGGNGLAISSSFHPNGKIASKTNYKKKGSEIKMPQTYGITVNYNDEYTVATTSWYDNGVLASETFRNANSDMIVYANYTNGKPMSIKAYSAQGKPFGIHKSWNEKGECIEYMNYSVNWVDTLCYTAPYGKIQKLNMRDRTVPLDWEQAPISYYGNELKKYFYTKATAYKTFYANGKLKSEVGLKDGKLNGLYHEYDSLGNEKILATYKADVPDGAWTEWYPNGKVKKSFYYRNGMRNGNCTEYYPTGAVKWENIYVDGVAGAPKAYAENGTLLSSKSYLEAFYPPNCLEAQMKNIRGAALHYYFMDTTVSNSAVTIPDSLVDNYVYKVIAMTNAITPDYDMCNPKSAYVKEEGFDIYHSCFVLSKSLYTDANLAKIKAFFGRHGLTMDKTAPSENPVLGLEKEYLVYYSGKQMLNKRVIIDSLEFYLAPRAIDASQGYILSVDNNVPEGGLAGIGSKAKITSDSGHATITVESGIRYPSYPAYDTWKTTTYIVYDDLTCDEVSSVYAQPPMLYWGGN